MRYNPHIFLIICFLLFWGQTSSGQVTIGSNQAPLQGALLDLKQWSPTPTNNTADKGLLLPRVSLKALNQLTPLYGGVDNGDGTWTDESTSEDKLSSIGIILYNINKDAIDIYAEGVYMWDAEKWVSLMDNTAIYTIDCENIVVNGEYKKNQTLDTLNTITVQIDVTSGGIYDISTDQINGISFKARGLLAEGTHTITLKGEGTVTINRPFDITIIGKTKNGKVECVTEIPVSYPDMTYAVIGASNSYYTWGGDPRRSLLAASTQSGGSFSPSGIVRVAQLSLWGSIMTSTSAAKTALGWSYFNTNGTLDPSITYPDVILYYSYLVDADAQLAQLLSAYVNAGGGILFGSQDNSFAPVNIMMEQIFGLPNNVAERQTGPGSDDVYPISTLPNDPIINGPFGDLSGKYWGEDNASTGSIILTQLPENSVQICTARSEKKSTVPLTSSIVWYNNAKNFVYIGDSTGASTTSTSSTAYPTKYIKSGNDYYPDSKNYGPTGYRQDIYNAALELNALAWLLEKAAQNGINLY